MSKQKTNNENGKNHSNKMKHIVEKLQKLGVHATLCPRPKVINVQPK